MPLKLKSKHKPKAPKPAAPKQLTIEEAREKYEAGTQERAVAEIQELRKLADVAREHNNSLNRQGTQAKKALKAFVDKEGLKPEDELRIGDTGYRYDVTHNEKVSVEKLYDLVKTGKITQAQFLGVIAVMKGPAEHLIGAHVLRSITEPEDGKDWDIRKEALPAPVDRPTVVRKLSPPKPKNKLKRDVEQAPAKIGGTTKLRKLRKIKV